MKNMLLYEGGRRLYLFAMTENMRHLMRRWQKELFPEDLKREKGIVERDIWSAATLYELDDAYSRKMANIDAVDEFYHKVSCCNYFDGVSVPMAFINSADDPIIPPNLRDVIKDAVSKFLRSLDSQLQSIAAVEVEHESFLFREERKLSLHRTKVRRSSGLLRGRLRHSEPDHVAGQVRRRPRRRPRRIFVLGKADEDHQLGGRRDTGDFRQGINACLQGQQ